MKKSFYTKKFAELDAQEAQLKSTLADVQRKKAALDVVWNEICGGNSLEIHNETNNSIAPLSEQTLDILIPRVETENASHEDTKTTLKELNSIYHEVENFAKQAIEPFTAGDVIENMGRDSNRKVVRSAIYAALKSLETKGIIVLEVPGAGRRPGTYKRSAA